ncbi:AsmA family protein, partial [Achromobacter aegrifaciens]
MPLRMPKLRLTRRVGKILLGIAAFVLILFGVAAWQVPKVLHNVLVQDVSKMIGRDVSVGDISFNPFTLTVRARDLAVAQPDSQTPLLTLAELDVSAAWTSLFWFAPVVDRMTLREPNIAIVREDVTRFNFSDIQQRVAELTAAQPEEPPKPDEGLPRFSLNNMVIENGTITLDDKVTGRKQVVDELGVGVPFISTFGYATDIDVQPRVHLRINGSPFDLNGVARPFDKVPSSTLRVAFNGLQLEKWADVWPMPLPFKVESALLDSNLQVVFEQPKDAPPKIRVVGDLGLRRLDLRDTAGANLVAWSALTVTRLELEPIARHAYVGEVGLWAPQIHVRRYANANLNWLDVVAGLKRLGGVEPTATPVADKLRKASGLDPAKAGGKAGPAAAPAQPQAQGAPAAAGATSDPSAKGAAP